MMDIKVKLSPRQAADAVVNEVVNGSFSGELIDWHEISAECEICIVLVLEKYFMRNSSRASLTVMIDNLSGLTRVHAVGSGGGQGTFLKFDWGSGSSLENNVLKALQDYI